MTNVRTLYNLKNLLLDVISNKHNASMIYVKTAHKIKKKSEKLNFIYKII